MLRMISGSCSRSGTRYASLAVLAIGLFAGAPGAFGATILTGSIIEAVVDTDVCLHSPAHVPCQDLGSSDAAAPGNTNPIRLTLSLIAPNGTPVTGLVSGDFDFEWRFGIPFSIPSVGTCPSCFEDTSTLVGGPPGMYVIFATPSLVNWEDVNISRMRIDVTATTSVYMLMRYDLR